jgi:hypothetical protein
MPLWAKLDPEAIKIQLMIIYAMRRKQRKIIPISLLFLNRLRGSMFKVPG